MKNIPLVVGNRVIYEYDGEVLDEIITDKQKIKMVSSK